MADSGAWGGMEGNGGGMQGGWGGDGGGGCAHARARDVIFCPTREFSRLGYFISFRREGEGRVGWGRFGYWQAELAEARVPGANSRGEAREETTLTMVQRTR